LERELALMQACWVFFDEVRKRLSAEMQKGPRGGGRDRDHIVRHTLAVEEDWAGGNGVPAPDGATLTDKQLKAYRDNPPDGFTRPAREASECQEHLVTHLDR
jgi:hypothetical protein